MQGHIATQADSVVACSVVGYITLLVSRGHKRYKKVIQKMSDMPIQKRVRYKILKRGMTIPAPFNTVFIVTINYFQVATICYLVLPT